MYQLSIAGQDGFVYAVIAPTMNIIYRELGRVLEFPMSDKLSPLAWRIMGRKGWEEESSTEARTLIMDTDADNTRIIWH